MIHTCCLKPILTWFIPDFSKHILARFSPMYLAVLLAVIHTWLFYTRPHMIRTWLFCIYMLPTELRCSDSRLVRFHPTSSPINNLHDCRVVLWCSELACKTSRGIFIQKETTQPNEYKTNQWQQFRASVQGLTIRLRIDSGMIEGIYK